jgi:hypothetical protein
LIERHAVAKQLSSKLSISGSKRRGKDRVLKKTSPDPLNVVCLAASRRRSLLTIYEAADNWLENRVGRQRGFVAGLPDRARKRRRFLSARLMLIERRCDQTHTLVGQLFKIGADGVARLAQSPSQFN